ncbi:hypothetical protein JOF48_001981 [Arthrobacter stackebrandtii]|uniref:N-formylglutamate amidohydrolase n=1 Tax=Arthrobacter stackebrandtii TaxID=272161 RepID=A0ABS4YWL5_9MICC|nr:N-formylglutamate amidohydrolase [Arthrobacter stackebrandtii]MBP2413182.1 hypothetical protein [Arthrobacter stackebrandtii]PYH01061.1 hypothetical protein CVV67_05530 [Arthrobacter stackebrandtii]
MSTHTPSNADRAPVVIPAGTSFSSSDITFYQGKDSGRTLQEAIAEADLVVSTPHAGDAVPEELVEFLAPEFTHRLQFDYSDRTTAPVCRAWAEQDPRIVYVENPHPRLLRDPNRARPEDLGAQLREAFVRMREAGAWNKVDLGGVDTIRPVTFSFYPLLKVPGSDAELDRMVAAFEEVAERGLGVYESTRDSLRDAVVEAASARAAASGTPGHVFAFSFHDTMNHTTTRDGAVNVERAEADRLPDVVSLSNRGDQKGEPRGSEVITMDPEMLRILAECHRLGFKVGDPAAVALNKPYLGSQEIIASGALFRELTDSTFRKRAGASHVALGAVQAEFLREYLLGPDATAALQQPGTGWPEEDTAWTAQLARSCKTSWDEFRSYLAARPE